jgi:hypothetical protein
VLPHTVGSKCKGQYISIEGKPRTFGSAREGDINGCNVVKIIILTLCVVAFATTAWVALDDNKLVYKKPPPVKAFQTSSG